MVVSTSGINIIIHHCNCSNEESISIIERSHSDWCNTDINNSCCTQPEELQSCCSDPVDTEHYSCEPTSDCCKIIQQFIKIDDNYLITLSKISFEIFSVIKILIPYNIDISDNSYLRNISNYLISLPPLLSGKSLVFFLNQLKIDIPVIS